MFFIVNPPVLPDEKDIQRVPPTRGVEDVDLTQ